MKATQWMILRRWTHMVFPWQPACQITFSSKAEAEAHMADLEPDFPGREFKVVEQKKA